MPATPSTHAAGRVSAAPVGWVFGADRSCVDAEVASYPVLKRFEAGRFNPGDFTKLGGIFARLSKRLRHLAIPGADRSSIRFDIAGRLRVLDVASRDLDALGRALSRGDVSSADAAAGKLSSLDTVMNPLASLMRRHHVIACANLLGPGSGSGSGHGASGSSIAA
jgi:hypothetical protein